MPPGIALSKTKKRMKITLLFSAYKANSKSLPGHIRLLKSVIILVFRT